MPVDLGDVEDADIAVIAMLARAQLEAIRRAERLLFEGATDDLRDLAELCGLSEVLGLASDEAEPR
jgi:ABC-type transporter Mla MlaB component